MMNIIKSGLFVLLAGGVLTSCAQSKYGVKKVYAFYQVHMPGNIPVDEKGRPMGAGPHYSIMLYVETFPGQEQAWDSVRVDGVTYGVKAMPVLNTPLEAGMSREGNQRIIIRPADTNKLWELTLVPAGDGSDAGNGRAPGTIILFGRFGKKSFHINEVHPTELAGPDAV